MSLRSIIVKAAGEENKVGQELVKEIGLPRNWNQEGGSGQVRLTFEHQPTGSILYHGGGGSIEFEISNDVDPVSFLLRCLSTDKCVTHIKPIEVVENDAREEYDGWVGGSLSHAHAVLLSDGFKNKWAANGKVLCSRLLHFKKGIYLQLLQIVSIYDSVGEVNTCFVQVEDVYASIENAVGKQETDLAHVLAGNNWVIRSIAAQGGNGSNNAGSTSEKQYIFEYLGATNCLYILKPRCTKLRFLYHLVLI